MRTGSTLPSELDAPASQFADLPLAPKLDILLNLYEGMAARIEIMRRAQANDDLEVHQRLSRIERGMTELAGHLIWIRAALSPKD